jgi:hypothetical protein
MSIKVYNIGDGTYFVSCGAEFVVIGTKVLARSPSGPDTPPDEGGGGDGSTFRDRSGDDRSKVSDNKNWIITRGSGTDAAVYLPLRGVGAPGHAVRVGSTDDIVAHLDRLEGIGESPHRNPSFIVGPAVEVDIGDLRKAASKAQIDSISLFLDDHE